MHRDVYVYYTSIHLCSPNSIPKANVRNSNPLSPEGATFRHSKYHLNQRSHVCICTAQESHSLKKHTRVWCNHYKLPSFLVLQALHRNILQLSYRSSCALQVTGGYCRREDCNRKGKTDIVTSFTIHSCLQNKSMAKEALEIFSWWLVLTWSTSYSW